MPHPDPPTIRRKPTRADIARINGALSRGPTSEAGKHRSSLNALTHGLRARRHLAVPALGEDPDEALAHFAAVRAELGATGPVARHLAETAAASILRASRADRLEGEFLASLVEGRGVAKALHADRDARATLALLQRYRREAEGELRRALDSLRRLHRARIDGLLPYGEEAEAAQAELDDALSELPAPNEPRNAKIEPSQPLVAVAANDDAPTLPTGVAMLAAAGAGHLDPIPPTPT